MAGRPSTYTDPGELEAAVQEYFATTEGKRTLTGLAYHLGFESRQSLYDYEKDGQFSYIIKRAKMRIEMMYEELLQGNTPTGSIFVLKNMGWKDKSESEVYGKEGAPLFNIIMPPGE
jgi:basic membrane lipoprotein Med (substrate-binding protein (PBP1-ABC) superfamily)